MANKVTAYIDDERPALKGTASFDGSPTLSGATVTLTAINAQGTKLIDGESCTVTIDDSEDTIEWEYDVQSGDLDTLGTWYIYLTVTHPDSDIQTVTAGTLEIKRPYG